MAVSAGGTSLITAAPAVIVDVAEMVIVYSGKQVDLL